MLSNFKDSLKNFKNYLTTQNNSRKPKLLIVGKDLKFILYSVKYLEKYYQIKINDLSRTNGVINEETKEYCKWADIIFCEWFEIYSIWLSNNVKDNQKLIIRAHRYEILRDFGFNVNFDNVDAIITVNYFFLELFSNKFGIPREKMYIVNNVVETSIFKSNKNPNYRKHIGLIGYSPEYKGYKRALEILNILKQHDDEFKLYLTGQDWKDIRWLDKSVASKYYGDCDEFIEENNLSSSIINKGWVDRQDMYCDIGYVLSVSDIESTHLSPIEGNADSSGAVILNWPGAEYIYPNEIVFSNTEDMANFILETYDSEEAYSDLVNRYRQFAIDEFGVETFVNEINRIIKIDRKTFTAEDNTTISFIEFKDKYLNDNNIIDEDKLLNDFKNSYIINDESEIETVILKNKGKKLALFISDKIETHRVRNIYQKYASKDILIFSLFFFSHIEEIERSFYLMSKFSDTTLELK